MRRREVLAWVLLAALLSSAATVITGGGLTTNGYQTGDVIITAGACRSGFTEVTAARGRYLVMTPSGGTDAGTLGSAMANLADASYTPLGSNSSITPTFTGSALAGHAHEIPASEGTSTAQNFGPVFGTGTSRTFTEQAVTVNGSFNSGADLSQSVSGGTPAGTVSAVQPTFTGTAATTMRSTTAPTYQARLCSKN